MNIGIDLDDVLLEFVPAFAAYHNRMYGTDVTRADFWSFNFDKVLGISREETNRRVYEFFDAPDARRMVPVESAQESVKKLAADHTLYLVTARQDRVRTLVLDSIAEHFSGLFSGVHFANHFATDGSHICKGDICDALGVDVFIEDSIDNARRVVRGHRRVLLFDTPWNRNEALESGIERVHSWEEIMERI